MYPQKRRLDLGKRRAEEVMMEGEEVTENHPVIGSRWLLGNWILKHKDPYKNTIAALTAMTLQQGTINTS